MKKYPNYRVFRANKSGSGCALSFDLKHGEEKDTKLFLTVSKQGENNEKGDATFKWKDKESVMTLLLGSNDIGEILSVMKRKKECIDLFHQNPRGNSTLKLAFNPPSDKYPPSFKIGVTTKREEKLLSAHTTISISESSVLEALLNQALLYIHGWV